MKKEYYNNQIENNKDSLLTNLEMVLVERTNEDLSHLSAEVQFSLIKSRVNRIDPEDEFLKKIIDSKQTNNPLKIKFGIDPTATDVHLGHTVPLIIANRLQRMGHKIIFVIGDTTAIIGDPTGKNESRPPLSKDQIKNNYKSYTEQVKPFFDLSKTDVRYNSEWISSISLPNLLGTEYRKLNISSLLQRKDFKNRMDSGKGLTLSELLYPTLMGLDSLELKPDIELGGDDQYLNLHICRQMMKDNGISPEIVMTTKLLIGVSGKGEKMSKSKKNYVALNDKPEVIYEKLLELPSIELIENYFKSLTEITDNEWLIIQQNIENKNIDQMDVIKTLARIIISTIYDKESGKRAEKDFFSDRKNKQEGLVVFLKKENRTGDLAHYISTIGENLSVSQARRLIEQNAVSINDEKITDPKTLVKTVLENNSLIKVGKDKFFRVNLEN